MEIWYIHLRKSLGVQTYQILKTFQIYCQSFFKKVGYNDYAADCMPRFNPILVEVYFSLVSCAAVVQASDSMTARPYVLFVF